MIFYINYKEKKSLCQNKNNIFTKRFLLTQTIHYGTLITSKIIGFKPFFVLKKYFFKFLVSIFTGLIYVKRFFITVSKSLSKPFSIIGLFLIKNFFIRVYKIYLIIYKIIASIITPLKQWAFAPLTGSGMIYIVLSIIVFTVLFDNINAQETRQDETSIEFRNNILFKLTSDTTNELIEERGSNTQQKSIYSYIEDATSKPYVSRQDTINELLAQKKEYVTITTEETLVKPSIASTQTNLKLRNKIEEYIILPGDTIGGIAEKFGLSIQTILWANNLTVKSYIKPAQKLIIPPANGLIYQIKKNDTLATIAKTYKSDLEQIISFNKLADSKDIQIGQTILLPGGQKPTPVISTIPKKTTSQKNPATVYEKATPQYSSSTSTSQLLWPTDMRIITQYYSWRHTGLDIDGTYQTRNYASEDGVVITAQGGWNGGYGLYIVIDHGNGLQTLYAHNSKLFVAVGDTVKRGQVIGMVGSTGQSTGTHIHYEVRVNGRRVNPLQYIK